MGGSRVNVPFQERVGKEWAVVNDTEYWSVRAFQKTLVPEPSLLACLDLNHTIENTTKEFKPATYIWKNTTTQGRVYLKYFKIIANG